MTRSKQQILRDEDRLRHYQELLARVEEGSLDPDSIRLNQLYYGQDSLGSTTYNTVRSRGHGDTLIGILKEDPLILLRMSGVGPKIYGRVIETLARDLGVTLPTYAELLEKYSTYSS